MKNSVVPLGLLILAAAIWRAVPAAYPVFSHIAPISALAFCAAASGHGRRWWAAPFAALFLSDVLLALAAPDSGAFAWTWRESALRAGAMLPALAIGSGSRRWPFGFAWLPGSLAASASFYLLSNTCSWWLDPFYAKSGAGWWQALTVGHPEYPPTWWFFRNTLLGDLGFTGLFWLVCRRELPAPTKAEGRALPELR
jgi:hypothetical protein